MKIECKRVLMIDDEPDITYIVEFILNSAGFKVETINDPTEAIPLLGRQKYDLIILDLMMARLDGFTLLKKIREGDLFKERPILILSSRQLSPEETSMLESNDAQVMAKPFEPSRLIEKVREIMEERLCSTASSG